MGMIEDLVKEISEHISDFDKRNKGSRVEIHYKVDQNGPYWLVSYPLKLEENSND